MSTSTPHDEHNIDFAGTKRVANDLTGDQEHPVDHIPKKKSRSVKRQKLNGAIRHDWMASWFINQVKIDPLEELYCTPGSPIGLMMFVQFLVDQAKLTMERIATYLGSIGGNVDNAYKDDESLQQTCKQCALNWKREWDLWKGSLEMTEWMATEEGGSLWRSFSSFDTLWEDKRQKLAEDIEGWFDGWRGLVSRVVIPKSKHIMLDEAITEPGLTCISKSDLYSSWDDISRIRQDSHADYHQVRFFPHHFTKIYGASLVYVAKCFKKIDYERQILAQHRMFMEMQISGIRMSGIVNPVAMINDDDHPTLVFPYWNGGTLEDMLHNMKSFQDQVQMCIPTAPDHKLHLFMENRLEISLALLETLRCMHSKGWTHNNLHARNILLHFPTWQWTKQGEPKLTGSTNLIFVGISNFGKACKIKQANDEWSSKFHEWNWITAPNGPPKYIAPELFRTNDTNQSHWEGKRVFTEMTDVYALGTSIFKLCNNYFAGWDYIKYNEWHDRLNHTKEFRERIGVEARLVHLLHRLTHLDPHLRLSAKINTRQWRRDLGVTSGYVYRPFFGWSV